MPKFQCPEGTTSVSVGGEQFNADENGQIDAPDSLGPLLEPHGFKRAPEAAAPAADDAPATTRTTKKAAAAPAAE